MALPNAIAAMAGFNRWVGWRWVTLPDGRRDKPPFRGDYPEFHASTTKPNSWVPFSTAAKSYEDGKLDGIGYVCADDADRVYWDLDNCRDPVTGEIADWATAYVEECDSYTEITPSLTGLRIIGTHGGALKAPIHSAYELPGGGTGEVFFRAVRYITVTGNRLPGTPDVLRDISGPVLDVLARAGKAKAAESLPDFGTTRSREEALAPIEDVRAALTVIPNADIHYDDWVRVGMAAFSATSGTGEGFEAWQAWSAKSTKHHDAECLRVWQSIRRSPPRKIGFGSLCYLARAENPFFTPPSWRSDASGPDAGPLGETPASGGDKPTALWVDEGDWELDAIPKRPWAVPNYLLRGSVSMLSGQGAGGKSSLVVAWTISAATGEAVGEFAPPAPMICVNYNVEDDQDEQRRRYSAALAQVEKSPRDIARRIIRCGPQSIGTLFERDHNTGRVTPTAAMSALEALCEQSGADILICDPLAELHNAEENDNTAMRAVIAAFRGLAQRLGIAVLILHHDRKGNNAPGDMDRMRGASSMGGAVRVAMTLTTMSNEEAEKFGVPTDQRRRHFRVDGAKANYSPAQEADWWRLAGVEIPNGEIIAAAAPWTPPSAFAGVSLAACVSILGALRRGLDGHAFGAKGQAKGSALEMMQAPPFGLDAGKAAAILAAWKREGTIREEQTDSPNSRHKRLGIVVDDAKFQEMRRQGGED
jgi:hypothetical protein